MAAQINWEQFSTEAEAVAFLKTEKEGVCYTTEQARQYIRKSLPKESYYQDKIIKYIKELIPSAFVWKAAAGAYSRQGIPDVCAVINGRYYGFEVKRPLIGVLSKIQEQTIKQIKAAGGRAYVVTYAAEVAQILKEEIEMESNNKEGYPDPTAAQAIASVRRGEKRREKKEERHEQSAAEKPAED